MRQYLQFVTKLGSNTVIIRNKFCHLLKIVLRNVTKIMTFEICTFGYTLYICKTNMREQKVRLFKFLTSIIKNIINLLKSLNLITV